jgi:hypothetical protein
MVDLLPTSLLYISIILPTAERSRPESSICSRSSEVCKLVMLSESNSRYPLTHSVNGVRALIHIQGQTRHTRHSSVRDTLLRLLAGFLAHIALSRASLGQSQ